MNIQRGDMFASVVPGGDVWIGTPVSASLRKNGALVMGAGHALQVKQRWPGVDRAFGVQISMIPTDGTAGITPSRFGVLPNPSRNLLAFQTKLEWRWPSSLELIGFSARKLDTLMERNPSMVVHLAMPGTGLGGLREDEVLAELARWVHHKDRLHLWSLA